jgi:hypothetical protein
MQTCADVGDKQLLRVLDGTTRVQLQDSSAWVFAFEERPQAVSPRASLRTLLLEEPSSFSEVAQLGSLF